MLWRRRLLQLGRGLAAANAEGVLGTLAAYAEATRDAWIKPVSCKSIGARAKQRGRGPAQSEIREIFESTDALTEALLLSLKNGMVVELGRADASRRTHGCLYGFETVGGQEYALVSPRVSLASTVQSLASAVLIFLFLLAVRNLLRLN